jgi:hypothetical protein
MPHSMHKTHLTCGSKIIDPGNNCNDLSAYCRCQVEHLFLNKSLVLDLQKDESTCKKEQQVQLSAFTDAKKVLQI